jgi:hypothetical protein
MGAGNSRRGQSHIRRQDECDTGVLSRDGYGQTTLIDSRISAFSALLFTPTTAHGAAVQSSLYVASQKDGEAVIAHAVTGDTDCDFAMLIIG